MITLHFLRVFFPSIADLRIARVAVAVVWALKTPVLWLNSLYNESKKGLITGKKNVMLSNLKNKNSKTTYLQYSIGLCKDIHSTKHYSRLRRYIFSC